MSAVLAVGGSCFAIIWGAAAQGDWIDSCMGLEQRTARRDGNPNHNPNLTLTLTLTLTLMEPRTARRDGAHWAGWLTDKVTGWLVD